MGWGGERVPPGSVRGRITSRRRSHVAGRGAAAGDPMMPTPRAMSFQTYVLCTRWTTRHVPRALITHASSRSQPDRQATSPRPRPVNSASALRCSTIMQGAAASSVSLEACTGSETTRRHPVRNSSRPGSVSLPSCPHESALEVFGLSDVIPEQIHLSVPRSRRKLSRRPGVALHTTTRPLDGSSVVVRNGMRLTAPGRTIADVAAAGVAPKQVARAIREAVNRGLTTPSRLREAGRGRGRRVEQLVELALAEPGHLLHGTGRWAVPQGWGSATARRGPMMARP